jgi:hypothetical protein
MKTVRISIEWNYMVTGTLFRYTSNQKKLKLLESATVSRVYIVATLFRNFHVCCYGSETSNYFDILIDTSSLLESYVNQTAL